ncbi:MAG: T9SS type A sorting domain-containing protein [Candidatus Latescibacterota bacterium]|nr:MAG: T9SS type A sorting domain-containing protein [Candidatus Latescibacterota bacterium]
MRFQGAARSAGKNGMRLGNLEVGGIVAGDGTNRDLWFKTDGGVTVEPGGFLGGKGETTAQGRGVKLESGGPVQIDGKVRANEPMGLVTNLRFTVWGVDIQADSWIHIGASGVIEGDNLSSVRLVADEDVLVDGQINADRDINVDAGEKDPTVVNGTICSRGGHVKINSTRQHKAGNVTINGKIKSPAEIEIYADTLFIGPNAEFCSKTVQKKAKVIRVADGAKFRGPNCMGTNKSASEKNKADVSEDRSDRDGSSTGTKTGALDVIGPAGAIIDLRKAPGAYEVDNTALMATGVGGTIDLRGNLPGNNVITNLGTTTLMADNILLDPGVMLSSIIGPGPVVSLPGGPARSVANISFEAMAVYPGTQVDAGFRVKNLGNVTDTYMISVTDTEGWPMSVSNATVTLAPDTTGTSDSLVTITLDVPDLAATFVYGTPSVTDSNTLTMTVTSLSDPSVTYTETLGVPVFDDSRLYMFTLNHWETHRAPAGEAGRVTYFMANHGHVDDTYTITTWDSLGWGGLVNDVDTLWLASFTDSTPGTDVPIPEATLPGTRNVIYVAMMSLNWPESPVVVDTIPLTTDGPVPVFFQQFDAIAADGIVELFWSVAADGSIDEFRVYRGAEGVRDLEVLERLDASARAYTDASVKAGERYRYVLEAVDETGAEWRSPELSVGLDSGRFYLAQNTPNPFNPSTTIAFELDRSGDIELVIYDARGGVVRRLIQEHRPAGRHSTVWDSRNDSGARVASGVYFYRLRQGTREVTRKMVLMK